MTQRHIPVLPIFFMLMIAVAVYALFKNVEFKKEDFEVGLSSEARQNPLLAASRLLDTEGFNSEIHDDRRVFSELDINDTGVLWLTNIDVLKYEQEAEDILAWMEAGGNLLTSSASERPFERTQVSSWLMRQLSIKAPGQYLTEPQSNDESHTHTLALPDQSLSNNDIDVSTDVSPYFQSSSEQNQKNRILINSPYLIHGTYGKGFYSVYANNELFYNNNIDKHDHAYLLLWLTQPAVNNTIGIVFSPAEKPGLFTVLWSKFTLSISLFAIFIVGFLRWSAARLGPIEQELPPIKNNIMAHLEARGNFWHKHKYTSKILEEIQIASRESLTTHSKHSLTEHGDDNLSKTAIIQQACAILNCSPEQAEHTLFGRTHNKADFLHSIQALQRLNHRNIIKSH